MKKNQKEELLADKQHEIWAHWMKYQFSKCQPHKISSLNTRTKEYEDIETGGLVIPKDLVERWKRQMETPYSKLTDKEKESDREQVRKFIDLI